jgi:HK97 family phage prohead protease
MSDDDRPVGEIRIRQATQLAVDYPQRTIDLVVMPYDTDALVEYQGRMVFESVAPGAFEGVERRANRIRVNRDHALQRTVGRAVTLYPNRPEGLVARVRIARTELGDETLALADDECLDASAGFLPMPGGEEWTRNRDRVRLTKLWLGHIAMTPDPAYETANVLAVRAAAPPPVVSATPNLDRLRAERLLERYAPLL